MDDTLICPICGNALKSTKSATFRMHTLNKTAKYIYRNCAEAINHTASFYIDQNTNKIDFLKISIEPNYSKIIEIDFHNQKSTLRLHGNNASETIHLQRTFEPDFPALENLKKQVNLFILLY